MQNGFLTFYFRNKAGLLLLSFLVLFMVYSCSNSDENVTVQNNDIDVPDTLYFNENMRGQAGFIFKYDTLTAHGNIPRNCWVPLSVKGKGAMMNILKHSSLFFESDNPDLRVRKTGNTRFELFVSPEYSGYFPSHGGEYATLFPVIQPHEGYVFKTYFGKPNKYPERTKVMMLYEPIEEN